MGEIMESVSDLAKDQYGNYVIQVNYRSIGLDWIGLHCIVLT